MSPKRVRVLVERELTYGSKSMFLGWVIILPIVLSLIVTFVFGDLFSQKPRLGVVDEGNSQFVVLARQQFSIDVREYDTAPGLVAAVEQGSVDLGIVLPDGFDASIRAGQETEIRAYTWGESLAKDRTILGVTIVNLAREVAGQDAPIAVETISLGDSDVVPWSQRLLPLVILMAVFFAGVFLPATSIISEKERRTITALLVTPTTVGDVFLAKGILGVVLSLALGVVTLVINQALGNAPALLVLVLALGAVMAVAIGLILGAFLRDVTSLFAIWKTAGILLFAPVLIYMFPELPAWVGRLFPTYYLLQPIVDISLHGSGWADVAGDIAVLAVLDVILVAVVVLTLRRTTQFAA